MQIALTFGIILSLLALGIHVSTVLFVIGAGVGLLTLGSVIVLDFGNQIWAVLNSFVMTAIPLFVLLGELLLRSGITDKVYNSMSLWLARLPGGLLHTNIGASALLAAASGSSVATAATIGTVAIPTFKARGYNDRIVLGSIAASGTLGILIPPSINMIIYGSIADSSVGRLFIGGIVPGATMALGFMATIVLLSIIFPSLTGKPETRKPLLYMLKTLTSFLPSMIIIFTVMGSIYLGWATPTEAAALGVLAVLTITFFQGNLTIKMLHDSFACTIRTTAMILLIMSCAFYMNFIIAMLGIPQTISQWFVQLSISPHMTMWLIVLFYLILGTFIETIAMMVTTIPLVVPLVATAGYDPIWFGVFLMILCEASLITPPIGMNLYVVQGIRTDKGPLKDIIIGVLPFLFTMVLLLASLIYFPELVLWLPDRMMGQ